MELGLGQITKMTTQYALSNKKSKLTVIDNNQDWIDIFSNSLMLSENTQMSFCDLEVFEHDSSLYSRYNGVLDIVKDNKFDLIIINGPQGFFSCAEDVSMECSKTNILDLIDNNLNDEFIVIMNDYNRVGEKNTVEKVKKLLNNNNKMFHTYNVGGLTEQFIICTVQNKFINWL